ncbi:MAG TPA: hypothetical protein V6D35_03465 [Candidatus Sericytochromatia bacterium]
MTLGNDGGIARKINVFRLNPIHLTSCRNANKGVIWELFVGWGRVYLTCWLRFVALAKGSLQVYREW